MNLLIGAKFAYVRLWKMGIVLEQKQCLCKFHSVAEMRGGGN